MRPGLFVSPGRRRAIAARPVHRQTILKRVFEGNLANRELFVQEEVVDDEAVSNPGCLEFPLHVEQAGHR